MFLCAYYIAVPVCVIERPGVIQSMSRSADLTYGTRWRIFGLVLVVFIPVGAIGAILLAIGKAIGGQTAGIIVQFVFQAVAASFGAFWSPRSITICAPLRRASARADLFGFRLIRRFIGAGAAEQLLPLQMRPLRAVESGKKSRFSGA